MLKVNPFGKLRIDAEQSRSIKTTIQKSKFFGRVYEIVKKIPAGKVMTYGQIADSLSSSLSKRVSARTVGWALHANKSSEIPCHRVVNKDGKVALNYAFGGGWREQKRRLEEGRVEFIDEMHVDLEKCLWNPK